MGRPFNFHNNFHKSYKRGVGEVAQSPFRVRYWR
jgi:hypothetical protein